MSSIPQTSGIYMITCVANGKIYIGSAVNLYKRWLRHLSELRRGKHSNQHLLNAWNKYGEACFTFSVIVECDSASLLQQEQFFLDALCPYGERGFNIALSSTSPMKGRTATPETCEKLRNVHLGKPKSAEARSRLSVSRKGMKFDEEHCKNISIAKKGTIVSEETRAKLREIRKGKKLTPEQTRKSGISRRKAYIVISPDGTEMPIKGITLFCVENNLDASAMIEVAKGKRLHHKGWKCRYA